MKKIISFIFIAILLLSVSGCGDEMTNPTQRVADNRNLSSFEYSMMNIGGTDALGRTLQLSDTKKTDKTRYVGLFYSVWLGQHREQQKDIYNITKLQQTEEGNAALQAQDSELSRENEFHFWGEPLYGYYNMKDPWIVARHVELLTNAGIDYLCIDNTNAKVYVDATLVLLNTLLNFQQQGFDVPKVVFYTNSGSGTTVKNIYNNFYQTEKYDTIWFSPNGKPMIIGITEENNKASDQTKYGTFTDFIPQNLQEFFDVKESEWPNGDFNENSIPWMSWQYPQYIHSGAISVPVAQHSHSVIVASSKHPECGRGYNNATNKIELDYKAGANFQTMWNSVFERENLINNVLMTSWNEWMAIKYWNGSEPYFVDVYNEQYSRDMEMTATDMGDNFYMQMVKNVRQFKFTEAKQYTYQKMSIDIKSASSENQWNFVKAAYKDFSGDSIARNYSNASYTEVYTDNSNRNDIIDIKVVHDNSNLYFYNRTADDITPYNQTDLNWMNVLISAGDTANSFAGFNYIINRSPNADGTTSIEVSKGGYSWESSGTAQYAVNGNVMQISIPLSALGLSGDNCSIKFKVADNVTRFDNIMDYYVTGDSAPIGRLSYSYGY